MEREGIEVQRVCTHISLKGSACQTKSNSSFRCLQALSSLKHYLVIVHSPGLLHKLGLISPFSLLNYTQRSWIPCP